jgi:hypothetical protein
MSSQDDLTLLKDMYQRGEISDTEYDTLRRHVLWGTPLPELIDEPTMLAPPAAERPAPPLPRQPEAPRRPPWEVPTDETFRYEPPRNPAAAEPAPGRRPPWEVPSAEPARPYGYDAGPAAPPRPDPGPPLRRPEPGPQPAPPRRPDPRPPSQPVRRADPGPPSQPMQAPPRRPEPGPPSQPVRRPDPGPPSQPMQAPPRRPEPGPPSQPVRRPDLGPPSQPVRRVDQGPAGHAAYQAPRESVPDRRMPWEVGPGEDAPRRSRRVEREERDSGPVPLPDRAAKRRRGPRLAAVITAVVLVCGVAGFGGWYFTLRKTSITPTDYAAAVCGGMKTWKQDVDGQGSALNKSIQQLDDLPATRARVVTYYNTLTTRTETLRAGLAAAGAPDLPGAQAYADSLLKTVGDQVAALRDASTRASKLDVTGKSTLFQISLYGVLTSATTAEGKVVDALAHPQVPPSAEIAAALQDNADCTPFTG